MNTEECNGWTNRDTWLVPLHIDNDYVTYFAKRNMLTCYDHIDNSVAKEIAVTLDGREMIELDGGDWGCVNWTEIAKHWESERQEMAEEMGS